MPIRSYTCPTHGPADHLIAGEYPPEAPCPACQQPAAYTLGAPGPGIVTGSATPLRHHTATHDGFTTLYESPTLVMRQKGTSLERADYACPNGHTFGDDYEGEPPVEPACPECLEPCWRRAVAADVDWFTRDHPGGKWDDSLGMHIESRAHLNRVLKERGLVAVTPDEVGRNIVDHAAREEAKAKYDEQVVREMLHSYKHGPDAAEMNRVAESDPAMDWRVWAKQLGVE